MELVKAFSPALEHKFQFIINNSVRLLHGFIIVKGLNPGVISKVGFVVVFAEAPQ